MFVLFDFHSGYSELNFLSYLIFFFVFVFGFQLSVKPLSVLWDLLIILSPMEYIISIGNKDLSKKKKRFSGSCRASDLVETLLHLRIFSFIVFCKF